MNTRPALRRWIARGPATVAMLAVIMTVPAHAIPDPEALGQTVGDAVPTSSDTSPATRPCFLQRARWNVALDGPQPFC